MNLKNFWLYTESLLILLLCGAVLGFMAYFEWIVPYLRAIVPGFVDFLGWK